MGRSQHQIARSVFRRSLCSVLSAKPCIRIRHKGDDSGRTKPIIAYLRRADEGPSHGCLSRPPSSFPPHGRTEPPRERMRLLCTRLIPRPSRPKSDRSSRQGRRRRRQPSPFRRTKERLEPHLPGGRRACRPLFFVLPRNRAGRNRFGFSECTGTCVKLWT
jgi:hypothetical protein